MNDFKFYSPTRFVFGRGVTDRTGEELAALGYKRALIVYGQGSVVRTGTLDRVKASLDAAGVEHAELGGVRPNPEITSVRDGIALAREFGVPAKNILVSSGSNEAIYIIASYAAARENLILQPVYGEYKKALDGYGARTRNIFSLAEAEGARGAAVWLCNPCNPTGALIPGAELDADSVYDQIENSPKSYASVAVSKQNTGEDSLEKRIEDMRIQTALYAVNARYIKVSDTPGSAITNGSAGMFDFSRFCRTIIFNAESPISNSSEALAENFRQILGSANISEAEFDAAKKKLFQQLESAIASKSTRNNRNLANEIVSAFSDGIVFTSPEDDLQIAKFALENFSAADAVKLLKREFSGAKIKIFLSDSKAEIPQNELEKIVSDTFAAAQKSPHNLMKNHEHLWS